MKNAILFDLRKKNPYYIFCPPIKLHSAGVTVLHRLCHSLNLLGYPAFLVIEREYRNKLGYPLFSSDSSLITPELTFDLAQQHKAERLTPIVVLPDSVKGDPLASPFVCRYYLNYPGHLGGDQVVDPNEMCLSYSENIRARIGGRGHVLFLPISDPNLFQPPVESLLSRKGSCFYAAKFRHFHGGEIADSMKRNFEITRDSDLSLKKAELARLFGRSEFFYCFENSALAVEAALCGCPVVFMPNSHFTEVIAEKELGMNGFAWGDSAEELQRAKNSVHLFREIYLKQVEQVEFALRSFIDVSQAAVKTVPYAKPINSDYLLASLGREYPKVHRLGLGLNKLCLLHSELKPKGFFKQLVKKSLQRLGIFEAVMTRKHVAKSYANGVLNTVRVFSINRITNLLRGPGPKHVDSRVLDPHVM